MSAPEPREASSGPETSRAPQSGRIRLLRAVAVGPSAGVMALVLFLTEREFYGFPLVVEAMLVGLAFASALVVAFAFVYSRDGRRFWLGLHDRTRWWGFLLLILNTAWIWVIMAWGFALVSGLLFLHDVGTTTPSGAIDDPFADSWTFYLWSMLDAIPVFELPQTIGWELGFRVTDHVNRVLLLVYKLLVIIPLVETGRLIWRERAVSSSSDSREAAVRP